MSFVILFIWTTHTHTHTHNTYIYYGIFDNSISNFFLVFFNVSFVVYHMIYRPFSAACRHLEKAQLLYKNTVEGEGFWKIFFTVLGGGGLILALIHLLSFL